MGRWIRFFLAIGLGIFAGLAYGWWLNPVEYVDTTPDTLRVDFRSDYVLMVAEAYTLENDPAKAVYRLALLGEQPPVEIVREAIRFFENESYPDADIALVRSLASALSAWNAALETPLP